MDWIGSIHLWTAIAAMTSGSVVVFTRKGTRWHRRCGWIYVAGMAGVIVTAFLIYDLFGGFGPFHVAAIVAFVSIVIGMVPARRRAPKGRWVEQHAYWMCGSFVGLMAAATSEISTRYLDFPFGTTVIVATVIVTGIGVSVMLARVPTALRNMGPGKTAG